MKPAIKKLFVWRARQLDDGFDAQQLVDSLTCEGLPERDVPSLHYENLRAFRHLRSDARLAAAKRWLSERFP